MKKALKRIFATVICCALAMQPVSAQSYGAGSCSLMPGSKTCIDATPCKQASTGETVCLAGYSQAGALTVPQSCWQYGYKYACITNQVNTCSTLESNPACGLVGTTCSTTLPGTTTCTQHNYTYQCQVKAAKTTDQMVCSSGVFNTALLATPTIKNENFSKAALAQEIMRESATYGEKGNNLFSGVAETCTQGYYGLKNCCNSTPGAKSNAAMTSLAIGAAGSVVKYAGASAVDAASPYVFDAMYTVGKWTNNFDLMLGGSEGMTNLAANGPSLSAYGFTYQSAGAAAEASGGLMGANTTLATFGEAGSASEMVVTFNPYVFAAIVAIQILQNLTSCTQDEQMLALHRGSNLSTFIKEECSKKVFLLGCVEWRSTYCSFNSVLSKIINTQGKPQIGLPIEGCGGLTAKDVSSLDFTKIDFGEFTASMVQQAQKNAPTDMKGNYQSIIQNTPQGTAQKTNPALPSYQK